VAWGFAVLVILVYMLGAVGIAESKKRDFFLSPISIPSMWYGTPPDELGERLAANNIYEAEDELFKCIGRPKRPEMPLDMYAMGGAFLGFGILGSGGSIFFTAHPGRYNYNPGAPKKTPVDCVGFSRTATRSAVSAPASTSTAGHIRQIQALGFEVTITKAA
jgi:hypothetical protein